MTKVILGRYALHQYGTIFFGSDAFWEPETGVFGVATSSHEYNFYPISERDVQTAFDTVRNALVKQGSGLAGIALLRSLLQAVHRDFGEIDIRTHVTGIFDDDPDYYEDRLNHPYCIPRVQVVLLQLEGRHLFIACVGGFLVYIVRPTEQELIFGWDWSTDARAVVEPDFAEQFIWGHLDKMPKIYSWEAEVRPGDLIVVTTNSMAEFVAMAKLHQVVDTSRGNLEAANRQLMTMLESTVPQDATVVGNPRGDTVALLRRWGAAWAITCVEE